MTVAQTSREESSSTSRRGLLAGLAAAIAAPALIGADSLMRDVPGEPGLIVEPLIFYASVGGERSCFEDVLVGISCRNILVIGERPRVASDPVGTRLNPLRFGTFDELLAFQRPRGA